MTTFSVAEGTLNLSDLIDRALRGEGVVVTRQGMPVVEIKAIQGATRSVSDADLAWLDERRITPRSGGETPSASLAAIREGY